jgi:hypothetical protein
MFQHPVTRKIADFLIEIGMEVRPRNIFGKSFLSGILIENGQLFVDEDRLTFPGDLLHEAGHLAVAPADIRNTLSDEVELPGFNINLVEAGAIAWSYAAALHLGLGPEIVFHDGGYKGKSGNLLLNFSVGVYVGVNLLEDAGMTKSPQNAGLSGTAPYPAMIRWLRE